MKITIDTFFKPNHNHNYFHYNIRQKKKNIIIILVVLFLTQYNKKVKTKHPIAFTEKNKQSLFSEVLILNAETKSNCKMIMHSSKHKHFSPTWALW